MKVTCVSRKTSPLHSKGSLSLSSRCCSVSSPVSGIALDRSPERRKKIMSDSIKQQKVKCPPSYRPPSLRPTPLLPSTGRERGPSLALLTLLRGAVEPAVWTVPHRELSLLQQHLLGCLLRRLVVATELCVCVCVCVYVYVCVRKEGREYV